MTAGDIVSPALGEALEGSRMFSRSEEDHRADLTAARSRLEARWPDVAPLEVGQFWSYSPYAFLHRTHRLWYAPAEVKQAAIETLPYLARDRFVHQRRDSRHPVVFTYVRRPTYYAAFNGGVILSDQQRYGLGLVWHPAMGAVLQSQTGTDDGAWGTVASGKLYEASGLTPAFAMDGQVVDAQVGVRDLPDGVLTVTYPLGEQGEKIVTFLDAGIEVSVQHSGPFEEWIPLLKGDDLLWVRCLPAYLYGAGVTGEKW